MYGGRGRGVPQISFFEILESKANGWWERLGGKHMYQALVYMYAGQKEKNNNNNKKHTHKKQLLK